MAKFKSFFQWIKDNKYLILILILAAVLRFGGTNPGYSAYHSDEPAVYGTALEMVKKSTLDPGRYDYPATAMVINAFFYKFLFIPLNWIWYYLTHLGNLIDGLIRFPPAAKEADKIFTLYIGGERGINALFWGRYITSLFGLGSVFLVYILGKKIFRREVGLIAAFFLAFNFRHVLNSHITLPDIYNSFFLLLSLIASYNLWKSPSQKNYLLAGVTAGLSFATKYQAHAFLPLFLVHLFLSFDEGRFILKRFFNINAIAAALVIPVVFALTNPYYLIHLDKALASNADDYRKYGIGTNTLNLFPISYVYHLDFGQPLFFAILVGIIWMFRDWRKLLFLLASLLFFFFVFTYYSRGGFYIRNIIPATPIMLLFAASASWKVFELFRHKIARSVAGMLLVFLLLFLIFIPARNSVINSYYHSKEWNYSVMAKWLRENLAVNSKVAATPFDVPNAPRMQKTEFELDGNFSINEHKEAGAEWALMNLDWASGNFYFWMNIDLDHLSYWNKPVNILRQTFHGLAAEELFRYQVYSAIKPWQAPDANLIFAKIPQWPDVKTEVVKSYTFNNDQQGWTVHFNLNNEQPYQFDQDTGSSQKGSLVFLPGLSGGKVTRISSHPIDVKPEYLYKIRGKLKTEKVLLPREREGFLRVDFYDNISNLDMVGQISSVSSRVYGSNDWVGKEIIERAPIGSHFLVISFQVVNTNKTKIWLDDVKVERSVESVEDLTSKPPYQYKQINLDDLYPFSQGNL